MPIVERLPHEIFPQLLKWEEGDNVQGWLQDGRWLKGKFIGILEGKIYCKGNLGVVGLTPMETKVRLENPNANKRVNAYEEERIKAGIANDQYNEFLRIVKEQERELLNNWTPKQLI